MNYTEISKVLNPRALITYDFEIVTMWILKQTYYTLLKTAVLQMLKINKKKIINGKYWSNYVQWRNLLLLTPQFS